MKNEQEPIDPKVLAAMAKIDADAKAKRKKQGDGSVGSVLDPTIARLEALMKDAPDHREEEPVEEKPRILNDSFFPAYREPWEVTDPGAEFERRLAITFEVVQAGSIGILIGGHGTGKTRTLAETARKTFLRGARYMKTSHFFEKVRSTFSGRGRTQEEVMNEFRNLPLICLDEIDKRSDTPNENALLFSLIDDRFDLGKPTLVAGNVSVDRLADFFDEAILDRARVGGAVLKFEGRSFRKLDVKP